jgi:hypothetical protein
LNEEIYSSQKHLQQYQCAYEEYTKTKRALDKLFERFFSGVTPSYPDEDAMEQNLKKEEEYLIILQNDYNVLQHVVHLLKEAHQAVIISRRALNDALNMNTYELLFSQHGSEVLLGSRYTCVSSSRKSIK